MISKRSREKELEIDLFSNSDLIIPNDETKSSPEESSLLNPSIPQAVWQDDDEDLQINLEASNRLKKLKKEKSTVNAKEFASLLQNRYQQREFEWAKIPSSQTATDDILTSSVSLLAQSSRFLPSTKIDIRRQLDANISSPSSAAISSIHFYQSNDLILTTSLDRHIKLYKLNNEDNKIELDVQLTDVSIYSSGLIGNGSEIVCGGRKPYFHTYDLSTGVVKQYTGLSRHGVKSHELIASSPAGDYFSVAGSGGRMHIMSGRYKTEVGQIKSNSAVKAMTFYNEHTLISSGYDADVYVWDLRKANRCIERFHNEDGTSVHSLSSVVTSSSSYLSIGSESGSVSIYQTNTNSTAKKASFNAEKIKDILNLTTEISSSCFHPSGQLLAIASNEKKDQLKLVHLPSCTTYSNWPTDKTPLGKVSALQFNSKGTLLAVGNNQGKVLLYRLTHFEE